MNYRNRYNEFKKNIFKQRRFDLFKKGLYILVIFIIILVFKDIPSQEITPNIFSKYLNILNSIFTLSLLIVTAIYVYYSKKIVDLTQERSQSELIPKIWIFPEDPVISISNFGSNQTAIEFKIRVYNFGDAPAISSEISFSIPSEHKETNKVSFCKYSFDEFPILVEPNSSTEKVKTMHAFFPIESIEAYKKSFLYISFHFEDVDRNYHTINQYYDLYIGYDNSFYSWIMLLDEHYYIPRQKRKYTHDLSSMGYLPSEYIQVYRKTNIFST